MRKPYYYETEKTVHGLGIGKNFSEDRQMGCILSQTIIQGKDEKKLNLDNPQTFNEKLQWLKLYDRNPEYTKMVDKYEAKQYVVNIIGEEYIIPTLGVWDRFDDIDFNQLPDQFVLKCTHDSGGLVICKDKSTLDIQKARKKINHCLKRLPNQEWWKKEFSEICLSQKKECREGNQEWKGGQQSYAC